MIKKPITPRSKVKNALRKLWLYSRERRKVIKDHDNRCVRCGVKGSVAKGREVKIEVHHEPPIDWDGILDLIYDRILNPPQIPLCKQCHAEEHNEHKETQ